jgi:hypothetical protein
MKKWVGYFLFVLSNLAWVVALVLPSWLKNADTSTVVGYASGFIIFAEVTLLLSIALVGKSFIQAIKTKVIDFFKLK